VKVQHYLCYDEQVCCDVDFENRLHAFLTHPLPRSCEPERVAVTCCDLSLLVLLKLHIHHSLFPEQKH